MSVRRSIFRTLTALLVSTTMLSSCATDLPDKVEADAPSTEHVGKKFASMNRQRNPVTYIKLDKDVLRPKKQASTDQLPKDIVGPFELRQESLAAALELVMGNKKIPMAFQTSEATQRTVTITSLKGPMDQVIDKLCSLANLYCSYENGVLVLKDTETFTVSLPPMIAESYDPFVNGLKSISGGDVYVDSLTNSLIYTTTHRNQERAKEYFERLRVNTALIVYEIQVWEVTLTNDRDTGIDWEQFSLNTGNWGFDLLRDGSPDISNAIGIGAQFTTSTLTADAVLSFLQTQGAVKTISQPQLSVLSGSKAKLRVGNKRDYVSQITRTVGVNTADNVSVTTSKLETGLEMEIGSAWNDGTVYGDLKILLQNLIRMDNLSVGTTSIQLPETSDRNLETKIRVRPGDAVLIGGIVEERDTIDEQGPPGKSKPLFTTLKNNSARNSELVFMLRPRIVVFTENPPEQAQLLSGGMTAEPPRVQNTSRLLQRPLRPTPLPEDDAMPATTESMSSYLNQLPADQIAPAP